MRTRLERGTIQGVQRVAERWALLLCAVFSPAHRLAPPGPFLSLSIPRSWHCPPPVCAALHPSLPQFMFSCPWPPHLPSHSQVLALPPASMCLLCPPLPRSPPTSPPPAPPSPLSAGAAPRQCVLLRCGGLLSVLNLERGSETALSSEVSRGVQREGREGGGRTQQAEKRKGRAGALGTVCAGEAQSSRCLVRQGLAGQGHT